MNFSSEIEAERPGLPWQSSLREMIGEGTTAVMRRAIARQGYGLGAMR